jgi:hypothetical protein
MWIVCAVVLTVTLLGVTPVNAAFTTAEAQQVEKIRTDVVGRLDLALAAMAVAVRDQEDTLAMRRLAIIYTIRATREAMTALSLLVDVVSPLQFIPPDPVTRAQRVADAWAHLDAVIPKIDTARSTIADATGPNLRAASSHLAAARAAIGPLDRSLAYADARPPSYPALVGPHGDYDKTQSELARGSAYFLDGFEFAIQQYGVAALSAANWNIVVQSGQLIVEAYARGLAVMAGVGDSNVSQFWRILNYTKRLTDFRSGAMTERYFSIIQSMATSPGPELRAATIRVVDSWRHMDQSVWSILLFLNCSQTHDPQGCAAGQVN